MGYQSGQGLGRFSNGNVETVAQTIARREPFDRRGVGWGHGQWIYGGTVEQNKPPIQQETQTEVASRSDQGTETEDWLGWSDGWDDEDSGGKSTEKVEASKSYHKTERNEINPAVPHPGTNTHSRPAIHHYKPDRINEASRKEF